MASIKISGLTEQTTASDTDLLPVASSAGLAKRMTLANFVTWLASKLNSKFAPAGYGLGVTEPVAIDDADLAVDGGAYILKSSTLNSPFGEGTLLVIPRRWDETQQIAFSIVTGWICVRANRSGVWSEWEWLNPPMLLDAEYRTTERWRGKPVWVVAYNLGVLPNSTSSMLMKAPVTFTEIVDIQGKVYSSGGYNPMSNVGGLSDVWITGSNEMNFNVLTTADLSDKTLTLTVKYTKN